MNEYEKTQELNTLEINNLFDRANNLPQEHLIKITILNRRYWVYGQELCTNENGQMIKLELATRFFEEYYCAILVTIKEFEELLMTAEKSRDDLNALRKESAMKTFEIDMREFNERVELGLEY